MNYIASFFIKTILCFVPILFKPQFVHAHNNTTIASDAALAVGSTICPATGAFIASGIVSGVAIYHMIHNTSLHHNSANNTKAIPVVNNIPGFSPEFRATLADASGNSLVCTPPIAPSSEFSPQSTIAFGPAGIFIDHTDNTVNTFAVNPPANETSTYEVLVPTLNLHTNNAIPSSTVPHIPILSFPKQQSEHERAQIQLMQTVCNSWPKNKSSSTIQTPIRVDGKPLSGDEEKLIELYHKVNKNIDAVICYTAKNGFNQVAKIQLMQLICDAITIYHHLNPDISIDSLKSAAEIFLSDIFKQGKVPESLLRDIGQNYLEPLIQSLKKTQGSCDQLEFNNHTKIHFLPDQQVISPTQQELEHDLGLVSLLLQHKSCAALLKSLQIDHYNVSSYNFAYAATSCDGQRLYCSILYPIAESANGLQITCCYLQVIIPAKKQPGDLEGMGISPNYAILRKASSHKQTESTIKSQESVLPQPPEDPDDEDEESSDFVHPSTPVYRRGQWKPEPRIQSGIRKSATIYGRKYSSHAIERMQERGLTPSAIENTINNGITSLNKTPARLEHFDKINNIQVITCEKTGKVISIF